VIDVTSVDMVKFAQKVFELSAPQGYGFMHFTKTPLDEKEAESMIAPDGTLDMDYVHGRACKMNVRIKDGKKVIRDQWYDHTSEQLKQLLDAFDIKAEISDKHSPACNCDSCQDKKSTVQA
jgi:hypothetical protein